MASKRIKVRVLKPFIDKRSKRVHEAGDVLSITESRLAEIEKVDGTLVETVE